MTKTQPSAVQPVRTPQVFAGTCPKSSTHKSTRVYRTKGRERYCVCDDCGATWKQLGPAATVKEPDTSA